METITPGCRRRQTCVAPKRKKKINRAVSLQCFACLKFSAAASHPVFSPHCFYCLIICAAKSAGAAAKRPCGRRLPKCPAEGKRWLGVGLASLVAISERQRHQRGPRLRPDGQPAASWQPIWGRSVLQLGAKVWGGSGGRRLHWASWVTLEETTTKSHKTSVTAVAHFSQSTAKLVKMSSWVQKMFNISGFCFIKY